MAPSIDHPVSAAPRLPRSHRWPTRLHVAMIRRRSAALLVQVRNAETISARAPRRAVLLHSPPSRRRTPRLTASSHVDQLVNVSQDDAEEMCRRLAREEGVFGGISAAGALWAALQISRTVENATIVFIVCDRGDRYLSTGVFPA